MIEHLFKDIYHENLAKDAIINDRMEGFMNDYLMLHCLLKIHKPKTFMEIGTHTGYGTMIIKNALGQYSIVYSMDLPDEQHDKSKQHPISEGKSGGVGYECTFPYIQIRSDSMLYDFKFPKCEGYYIDGEHDWSHVYIESSRILKQKPKIVIWHDSDLGEVWKGIADAIREQNRYIIHRIKDTRIAYALKKDIC